jgi:hypothetical protein
MMFSELQAGDVFEAYGETFQKLPRIRGVDPPYANAINTVSRKLAFFGPTVPVDFLRYDQLEVNDGKLQIVVACIPMTFDEAPLRRMDFPFAA